MSLQSSSFQCTEEIKKILRLAIFLTKVAVISPIIKVHKNKVNRNIDGPSQQPTKCQQSYNTSCSLNNSLYSHNLSIYKLKIHVSITVLDLHFWTGQVEILCPWEKLLDPPLFFCSILYAPVSENGFYGKNDSCSDTSSPQYHFVLPFTPMSSQSIDDVGTFCTLFITYTLATVWLIYYGIFESNFIDTYYKSILDKMS